MAGEKGQRKPTTPKPEEVSVSDAADRLGELVNRVAFGGETVIITRYDKPAARLVPLEAA